MKITCKQCDYEISNTNKNWSNEYEIMFCERCNEFVQSTTDVKIIPINSSCKELYND